MLKRLRQLRTEFAFAARCASAIQSVFAHDWTLAPIRPPAWNITWEIRSTHALLGTGFHPLDAIEEAVMRCAARAKFIEEARALT